VGNDGETLVADSSTSTGLRYTPLFGANKNKFLNSDFGIWQRGVGTFTKTTGIELYTADRWAISNDAGTITCDQQTFTPGTAPVAGYEGQYFARIGTTAVGGGALYLIQKIEDVRNFAGQTVTLSYWAKVSSGTVTNTPLAIQYFGTGGSGDVVTSVSSSTITTSWQRFTHQIAIPSISGKTVTGNSSLQMQVLRVGVSATIDVWGYQIEAGSVATPFQTATGTLQGELAACQRYYYRITNPNSSSDAMMPTGFAVATTQANMWFNASVSMRVTPTSVESANIRFFDGVSAFTPTISLSAGSEKIFGIAGVTSGLTQFRPYYAIAATAANASYIGWSAEL
jgi:hypothetical protein